MRLEHSRMRIRPAKTEPVVRDNGMGCCCSQPGRKVPPECDAAERVVDEDDRREVASTPTVRPTRERRVALLALDEHVLLRQLDFVRALACP